MSYEVYIDVEHHPRHLDDDAKHERTAFKLADLEGDPLVAVASCLRAFADELEQRAASNAEERAREAARAEARERWERRHESD